MLKNGKLVGNNLLIKIENEQSWFLKWDQLFFLGTVI